MRTSRLLFLTVLLPALIACAPVVKDGQPVATQAEIVLRAGQTVGQTFTARDRGLNGLAVFLAPDTPGIGEVRLHLRARPQSSDDIAMATLAVSAVTQPGFYRFAFPPQRDSRGRDYYVVLELSDGALRVGTASGETYLDGALYQDDQPLDAQMAFRMTYDPIELTIGLAAMMTTWLQVIVIAILLFVLPGWALLAWLLPGWGALSWMERVGLASGMSLALYPLLILWTAVFDLRLGALYAWLPIVVAIGALAWRMAGGRWREAVGRWREAVGRWREAVGRWQEAGGNSQFVIRDPQFVIVTCEVLLIGVIIFTRFWAIRSLDVPMWGDSYHHTMIAQLLVDNGGLFDSWLPYAELRTFTYHFGFHSAVAAFHWISGASLPRATLWVGQIINILAVLALYPLAVRVGGSRLAGIGAVFVAGLLAPMPMFYTNWGRYTQLAGQVILPAAVLIAWIVLEARPRDRRLLILAWLAWAGLALTHYLVFIFTGFFFIAFFLLLASRDQIRILFTNFVWISVGTAFLFLPWFLRVFEGRLVNIFAYYVTTPPRAASAWLKQFNAIGDISFYLPMILWLLLLLSIGWGLWRHEKGVVLVVLWWLLNLLVTNPQWLQLPGEGVITNFTLFIASYIPASILIGVGFGWLVSKCYVSYDAVMVARDVPIMTGVALLERGEGRRVTDGVAKMSKWAPLILLVLVVISVGLWGMRERLGDLRTAQHALVARPDLRAAVWIQDNTSREARFLVNTFFAYGNSLIVGSDGGWWLPLLAQRQTTLPPLTYGSEQGLRLDNILWVNALTIGIQDNGIAHPNVLALLRERGVTHVYIGQRQGRVNYDGPHVLDPGTMLSSQFFRLIYHQDRVWIFEVLQ